MQLTEQPLDLTAVETQLKDIRGLWMDPNDPVWATIPLPGYPVGEPPHYGAPKDVRDIRELADYGLALLAHCRALRAALRPFVETFRDEDRLTHRMGHVGDPLPDSDTLETYGELTLGNLREARAVLALASDGGGGGAPK